MRLLHILVLMAGLSLSANLPASGEDATRPTISDDEVARLVEQLDANRFSKRRAATNALLEAGEAGIPRITKAALSDNSERAARSIDILKDFYLRNDEDIKSKAHAALQKIAKSGSQTSAKRAKRILDPQAATPSDDVPAFGGFVPGQIQLGGAQIQIQLQAGGIQAKSVTTTEVDGVRHTRVREGDRRIDIDERPDGQLKVSVTETENGQRKTSNYEAKNAAELKENHPQVHDLYQEYGKPGQPVKLQARNIQIQIPNGPPIPGLPAVNQIDADANSQIRAATDDIRKAVNRLKQLAKHKDRELDKVVQELEQVIVTLDGVDD